MINGEPYIEIAMTIGQSHEAADKKEVLYAVKADWHYAANIELFHVLRIQEAWIRANEPTWMILSTKLTLKY